MKVAVTLALSLAAIMSVQGQQITFSDIDYTVDESSKYVPIDIQTSQPFSAVSTVTVRTQDITAVAGSDYIGGEFTVTFPIGETQVTLNITILDDEEPPLEGDERFRVNFITVPSGATAGEFATVTIRDDCTRECQNGGTLNSTTCVCTCPADYTGFSCENCVTKNCMNGGTQDPDTCNCDCPPEYTGELCENCVPKICENGGTQNSSTCDCVCPPEYTGEFCENCVSRTCMNGGTQDPSSCDCVCPPEYTGESCENCVAKICENGGTQNSSTCDCICPPEYTGEFCENCVAKICENGGTQDSSTCDCVCPPEYTGEFCESCVGKICENGGTQDPDTCDCDCPPEYTGDVCQDCVTKNCENGGTQDSSTCDCVCPPEYTGELCENCVPKICENGGTQNSSTCDCDCPPEYTGEFCENCLPKICENGATQDQTTCQCVCPPDRTGDLCESCVPKACENEAMQNQDDCSCECLPGFTGVLCETQICERVCENGGTLMEPQCECACPPTYTGENCETPQNVSRCNDTIIGDPLYEVPVIAEEDGNKVSLCYEVQGEANQHFNLISDSCVSVNALYSPMINASDGNIISKIGVLAEDNNGVCQQIEADLQGCTARVNGSIVQMYNQDGVNVMRRTNRIRISVPNCGNVDLVMWVICEVRNGQPMIKFVVARGFNLSPTSHGLIGQFWNIKVTAEKYNVTTEDKISPGPGHYAVTVDAPSGTRSFFAWKASRTWDRKSMSCLYSGDAQGGVLYEVTSLSGSVIEGTYDEYRVSGLFEPEYKYEMFGSQC